MTNQTSDENIRETAEQQQTRDDNGQGAQSASTADTAGTGEQEPGQDMNLDQALAKLAEVEQDASQARGDLLRIQADMQNLRRRTEQDVEKAHKFALERFSGELLPVVDNLERALQAASNHDDPAVKAIHEGVELTLKSFTDVFSKFQIEAVDPHGEPFDPQLHQAMTIQENAEVEPDTVLDVLQKGYTLHGRVLRPAMVVVSRAPAGSQTE